MLRNTFFLSRFPRNASEGGFSEDQLWEPSSVAQCIRLFLPSSPPFKTLLESYPIGSDCRFTSALVMAVFYVRAGFMKEVSHLQVQ